MVYPFEDSALYPCTSSNSCDHVSVGVDNILGVADSKSAWRCGHCNGKNGADEKYCTGCGRAKKVKE